jgi:hypothetical protein
MTLFEWVDREVACMESVVLMFDLGVECFFVYIGR